MPSLDQAIDDLTASIRVAVRLYTRTRAGLEADIDARQAWGLLTAEDMKDSNGRPILLDAAVSLANARAALATALATREGLRR